MKGLVQNHSPVQSHALKTTGHRHPRPNILSAWATELEWVYMICIFPNICCQYGKVRQKCFSTRFQNSPVVSFVRSLLWYNRTTDF